jgi:hypothetical protein
MLASSTGRQLDVIADFINAIDVLPELPSFIGRICSGYAPPLGVLRTPSV